MSQFTFFSASSINFTNQWAWMDDTLNGLEWMITPGKRYSFSAGSRPEHRRQQRCLTLHKGGTAEKLTSTITSERVGDLWLPPLTHSDISPRRDYQCTLWWVWKRSAATIRFSHFFPQAPGAGEADIILQTVANRICSFWIQIFPRLTDLISSLLKMHHMWSKWMVRSVIFQRESFPWNIHVRTYLSWRQSN